MKAKWLAAAFRSLFIMLALRAQDSPADQAQEAIVAMFRAKPLDAHATMNASLDFALAHREHPRALSHLYGLYRLDADLDPVGREAFQKALTARYVAALARTDLSAEFRAAFEKEVMKQNILLELRAKPLDMKFTAADGREVDLAKLRGKVVLVEFWATWCVPCVAEIPNILRIYNAYHDKGFEVVGIAIENPKIVTEETSKQAYLKGLSLDTPDTTVAKKEAARQKLLAFVTERGLPWPQHYDGLWPNAYQAKYDVGAIPRTFLLGRDGRMVHYDPRGEDLEPLVRQLLGL